MEVVIVTGASVGLGKAICRQYASITPQADRKNLCFFLIARNEENLKDTKQMLIDLGCNNLSLKKKERKKTMIFFLFQSQIALISNFFNY